MSEIITPKTEIITIGSIGYSSLKDDQVGEAREFLLSTLTKIDKRYPKQQQKNLISGLTAYGIPLISYEITNYT